LTLSGTDSPVFRAWSSRAACLASARMILRIAGSGRCGKRLLWMGDNFITKPTRARMARPVPSRARLDDLGRPGISNLLREMSPVRVGVFANWRHAASSRAMRRIERLTSDPVDGLASLA
jgi:hypothetical protein